ncbi:MAG: hypothetical protein DRJ37_00450 [Thermoprotei archaeon]|nr:MAG: hypothetical protein DRJ37_00450 [Thermoprotei archaeon]
MIGKSKQERLWFIILILFIPCLLNISISTIIGFITVRAALAEGKSFGEIGLDIARNIFKYNFYWSIIQVGLGLYLVKLMGGYKWLKDQFSFKDFSLSPVKSVLLISALFIIASTLIWSEQLIMASFYGGWRQHMEYWKNIVQALPFWSKAYMVLIAPFTAGVFEEIIWRGYGISKLEQHMSTTKAVIVQAIAFGFWHGISLHTLVTALIGLAYGLVYAKRRRLLNISIAHIVTDIVGFYFAFMA